MFKLFCLRLKLLIKDATWVAPLIFTAGFIGIMYSMAPSKVCDCFLISSVFLYVISLIMALRLQDRENEIFEETLLLHCRSERDYHLAGELLLLCLNAAFSMILITSPVVKALMQPAFFTRAITPWDVLAGGITILLCGICGAETADLCHPRIIRVRKAGVIAVILISVLGLIKKALTDSFGFLKLPDIILPPVMDAFVAVGNTDSFELSGMVGIWLHMAVYAVIVTLIKICLLKKKRFG